MKKPMVLLMAVLSVQLLGQQTASGQEPTVAAWQEKITLEAEKHRHAIEFDGQTFSGPGWEQLISRGSEAQFFLIGEEHGIAENPKLAAQLFSALTAHGYSRLAIEISPPMAAVLDAELLEDGLTGLQRLFGQPGGEPAFFGMLEEAEFLASVRSAIPGSAQVLWGVDYEVASDRRLLQILQSTSKPEDAQQALEVLVNASNAAWLKYEETRSPQYIFSFSGDPELVRRLRQAWPDRNTETDSILNTLEETLEINHLWMQGKGWESNHRRASLLRSNFMHYWQEEGHQGNKPKVMAKLGASHLVRGLNMTRTFDLGSLLPELAAAENSRAFSIMVVPGAGSQAAVLNPSTWTYDAAVPKDGYNNDIVPITNAAWPDSFTLIDLAPLRSAIYPLASKVDAGLLRVIYGYDMLLVMSGSTASGELEHSDPSVNSKAN